MPDANPTTSAQPLRLAIDGSVARIVLDRPAAGNCLSTEMVDALEHALDRCEQQAVQWLVITGEGRHFCTGFDLSGLADASDDSLLARFCRIELLLQRVHRAPFSTVAVAHGRTVGAGADLFAACAHRLVAPDSTLSFPGFKGFGLVLGSRRLASLVGHQRARQWIENAEAIPSQVALETGLATGQGGGPLSSDALAALLGAPTAPGDTLLRGALGGNHGADDAGDLAALVRSAARRGLKQRVQAYVDRAKNLRQAGHPPAAR